MFDSEIMVYDMLWCFLGYVNLQIGATKLSRQINMTFQDTHWKYFCFLMFIYFELVQSQDVYKCMFCSRKA